MQAAGRTAEAADVLALKPGLPKKQRRASAPALMAATLPEQSPCQQAPPSKVSTLAPGRRQSHRSGGQPNGGRPPSSLLPSTADAQGPCTGHADHPPHRNGCQGSRQPGDSADGERVVRSPRHPQHAGQRVPTDSAAGNVTAGQKRPREQLPAQALPRRASAGRPNIEGQQLPDQPPPRRASAGRMDVQGQQLPDQLPLRRARPGRADCQAVLKGLRLLMTGSDHAARAEAERLAASMGATILSLDQVLVFQKKRKKISCASWFALQLDLTRHHKCPATTARQGDSNRILLH